jgi:hypothetical protein
MMPPWGRRIAIDASAERVAMACKPQGRLREVLPRLNPHVPAEAPGEAFNSLRALVRVSLLDVEVKHERSGGNRR